LGMTFQQAIFIIGGALLFVLAFHLARWIFQLVG